MTLAVFSGALPSNAATTDSSAPALSVTGAGRPLLQAAGMAPGTTVRRTVVATNRGDREGQLAFAVTVAGEAGGLAEELRVDVADASGRPLAYGTLAAFGTRRLERIPAGASRRLTVSVTLPAGAQASGARTSAGIVWTLSDVQ